MVCDACANLAGNAPEVEPHEGLQYLGSLMDFGGTLERYRCTWCQSPLQRIVPGRGQWPNELYNWVVM